MALCVFVRLLRNNVVLLLISLLSQHTPLANADDAIKLLCYGHMARNVRSSLFIPIPCIFIQLVYIVRCTMYMCYASHPMLTMQFINYNCTIWYFIHAFACTNKFFFGLFTIQAGQEEKNSVPAFNNVINTRKIMCKIVIKNSLKSIGNKC